MNQIFGQQLPDRGKFRESETTLQLTRGPRQTTQTHRRGSSDQPGGEPELRTDLSRTRFHQYAGDETENSKAICLPSDGLINSTGTGTLGRVG